jgi:hypothetical protein
MAFVELLSPILKARIARRQCVAFVGAGFSMPCGMPGWEGLLNALYTRLQEGQSPGMKDQIDSCKSSINSKQFDIASTILKESLPPAEFDAVIQSQFGIHRLVEAPPQCRERQFQRMRWLASCQWAGVVTTNYDNLIETALAESILSPASTYSLSGRSGFGRSEIISVNGDDNRIGTILATPRAGSFFVKVHGSVGAGHVVLSTADYDRTYLATPRMTSFLTSLMMCYHIIFIGCSLEDEIVRLRRSMTVDFCGMIPLAYAVLPKLESNLRRKAWLRSHATIECILYDVDDAHTGVDLFLQQSAECVDWVYREGAAASVGVQLRQLPLPSRLNSIGELNLHILRMIAKLPMRSVSHIDLIELEAIHSVDVFSSVVKITPEERIYRVLFLVSLGLLDEIVASDGAKSYSVKEDVCHWLNCDEARTNRSKR